MKQTLAIGAAVTFVCVFLLAESPGPVPAPQPPLPEPAAVAEPAVDLGTSFMIPQGEEAKISHSPAVVYADGGKRMLTATSEGEIVVFETAGQKLLKRIRIPDGATDSVSMDPAGTRAVWVALRGGLTVMELSTEKVVSRLEIAGARWVAVAPDGRSVAVTVGKEIQIRALPDLKLVRTLAGHEGEPTNVAWNTAGTQVGSTAQDGRLLVHTAADGAVALCVKKEVPLHALSFRPGGKAVAYGGQDNKVYQHTFEGSKEEVLSQNQPYWITSLGYSPDGALIAAGDESCDIWLYEVETKHLTFHNKHHVECWLSGVSWAPDNETFLFACRPNSHAGRPQIWTMNLFCEGNKSAAAVQSRTQLLQTIDKRLAASKDEKERGALQHYREALAKEDKLGSVNVGSFAVNASSSFSSNLLVHYSIESTPQSAGGTALNAAPTPVPGVSSLPKDVQDLAAKHQQTVQQEVQRIEGNYCVNQWRVKRK